VINETPTSSENLKINPIKKSVLITGGAGYIGSHVAKYLHQNGYTPVVVGRSVKDSLISNLINDCFELELPKDNHLLDDIVKRYDIDTCIHTASSKSIINSMAHPDQYYKNNVIMTIQLLNKLNELGIKKVIFDSSASVYGAPKDGICRDTETNLQPINTYGQTKLMCEQILKDYYRAYNMMSVSLRIFNAAGSEPELELGDSSKNARHIIPLIVEAGFKANEFYISGKDFYTPDGTCMRDYVHIQDVADAHLKAITLLGTAIHCESLNIGSGVGITNQQIVDIVSRHTGAIDIHRAPKRLGDPGVLVADISRTEKLLNWKPEHSSIDNIVRSAVQWYKQTNKKEIN